MKLLKYLVVSTLTGIGIAVAAPIPTAFSQSTQSETSPIALSTTSRVFSEKTIALTSTSSIENDARVRSTKNETLGEELYSGNTAAQLQENRYNELEQSVVDATQTYLDAWTFEAPMDWEPFRSVFMPGEGEILIVDNFGDDVTVLNSVDAYIETWSPVVASVWQSLETVAEDLDIYATEDLAVSSFILVAEGTRVDGTPGTLEQRATLVWQRNDANEWRVVREHLTTLPSSDI